MPYTFRWRQAAEMYRSRRATPIFMVCFILVSFLIAVCSPAAGQSTGPWRLVWADEFDGKSNTPPDPSKWKYDLGDGSPRTPGWGNYEKQLYTDDMKNVSQDGEGHLVIRALK